MTELLPHGVYRRNDTSKLYLEMRLGDLKLYCNRIANQDEGALCHDIARRYWDAAAVSPAGGKRKAPLELNYPDFSASLELEELPVAFTRENKGRVMDAILRQACAAAKELPVRVAGVVKSRAKVQKHSAQDVGRRSVGSSSQKGVCSPSRGTKKHLKSVIDSQKFLNDVCELINQCRDELKLKVIEREELEQKVKDIKEDSGYISFHKSSTGKFLEHMACFKQLVSSAGKFSSSLEACEQNYILAELECCKLRKTLEGHNLNSIPGSLMGDGNTMMGRQRANEKERLPLVLEVCSTEEQNSSSMPTEISEFCVSPTAPLVLDHVMPCAENDNAMPSTVESDMSQPVASYEFALRAKYTNEAIQKFWSSLVDDSTHTGCRREDEEERPAEVNTNSNSAERFQDDWSRDWSDGLFSTDQGCLQSCEFSPSPEFSVCIPQM
ncbi:hypothetical protein KC19_9G025600 [Ceratodon purpureus]|uniref:Uncharacterized protein n=1 Tax=Ceratodon purpureus TaxID=3225 RepID=A0A8T0GN11_CERPU|nr:hypothetical protein KC19_9G025600 [Ceratodon purpureus]